MRPLKRFEEYVKEGIVNKISPDINRANALEKESVKRAQFLKKMIEMMGIDEDTANSIVENSYDALMEKIRSLMLKQGYHSQGQGAHTAEVAFTFGILNEYETRYLNDLRYRRNGILYYGKDCTPEYAKEVYEFMQKALNILH